MYVEFFRKNYCAVENVTFFLKNTISHLDNFESKFLSVKITKASACNKISSDC